jgi:alkylhydroperoxidase family enzyme
MKKKPIIGQAISDILSELHAHVFIGVPGESDPFTLTMLEREYIAYVISLYYQCDHCQEFHARQIKTERKKAKCKKWDWKPELIKTTLFLRESKEDISDAEWKQWLRSWKLFATKIDKRHPGVACYIAYAIGIARRDEDLMDLAHKSIKTMHASDDTYRGVIRDIDRVVIFMKAATSKNRTDPVIRRHMESRGIATN